MRVRYVTACLAVRHAFVRQAPLVARAGGDIAAGLAEPGVSIVVVAEVLAGYLAAADRHQRALLVVFELVRI